MDARARRESMAELLAVPGAVYTGQQLADRFGVSRQVVVYDVALLRAQGAEILATPRGYMMSPVSARHRKTLACRHQGEDIERELSIIVDHGGTVIDVVVEHPLYGDLTGVLMLTSRHEVRDFVARLAESGARPLAELTEGVHLHTVEAQNPDVLVRIEKDLDEAGFLVPES